MQDKITFDKFIRKAGLFLLVIFVLLTMNYLSREALAAFIGRYGLAMDLDDIAFCQDYFRSEGREPTIT